ncbi:MAG: VWA domain-containing protein [Acidobacteria bacterium]|nr:VWA domain-containing protein [Acidobacteriota bacterium]
MRRLATLTLVFFLFPALLPAQQTSVVPTIRAGAQLVVVDVIVRDKNGNPVRNLPKSTFTVTEDKKQQSIQTFEEHHAGAPAQQSVQPVLPPGIFSNYHPLSTDAPLNIILFDTLNTPVGDLMYVRQQMNNYIKKARPGQRIAIFGMASHLYYLQGFSSDPETLRRAIAGGKTVRQSPMVGTEDMAELNSSVSGPSLPDAALFADQFAKEEAASRNQLRAQYTLDSLNQLARYLTGFPGRKNLIWFSGNFPVSILPQASDMIDPFTVYGDFSDQYRETVNLMAKAQVAVYPIDARGVFGAPVLRADQSSFSAGPQLRDQVEAFHTQTGEERATMLQMADDTGGKAFINTNDLASAVKDAIADGSDYYTLTYSPTNKANDGFFRKIKITAPGDYRLRYRSGYYAASPEEIRKEAKKKPARVATMAESSMRRGAPEPTQIFLRMRVTPIGTEPGGSVTSTAAADNAQSPKVKGPYRNYTLTISADPAQMSAKLLPDGRRQMDLEFTSILYDIDGNPQASITNQLHGALDAQAYNDLFAHGVRVTQQISAPAKGEYFLRTGVHDLNNDALGAVEIPLAITRQLPAINK